MVSTPPLDEPTVRGRLAQQTAQLRSYRWEAEQLAGLLPELAGRAAADRRSQALAAGAAVRRRLAEDRERVAADRTAVQSAARKQVEAAVVDLAPGPLGAGWDDPVWAGVNPSARVACHVRVGSVSGPVGPEIPLVLPLLGTAGWLVYADQGDFAALVRAVLLRCLAAVGPYQLAISCYDPALALGLGVFGALRQVAPDALRPTATTADALASEVDRLVATTARVGDDLAGQGFATLVEAWRAWSGAPHPFQLLVIDSPLDEVGEETLGGLDLLLRSGAPRGVSLLLRRDPTADQPRRAQLAGTAALTTITRDELTITAGPGNDRRARVRWRPDPAPLSSLITTVVDRALTWPRPQAETPDFAELIEELSDRWLDPGDQGVRALIGRSQGRPCYLELRSENPPMPNALVGGAVGQGKSNLLLVLIHALAAQYAPTELELVLLDFRDGVEFAPLGPRPEERSWLPHAIVLGLECDREFGLAVLEDMAAELASRTARFQVAGVAKINDYRRRTGEPMPRRVLIIDEFQRLIDGDDATADRCVQLLDDLARTGRAAGFHLILASQTLSGIRGLAARSDAIFAQFHHRISLRNTPSESAAILAPHNTAAAELVHRGEVIMNSQLGDPTANRRAVVAHADHASLVRLRRELWMSAPPEAPPLIFRRSRPAPWTQQVRRLLTEGGPTLTPGAPISVREPALRHRIGRGGDQSVAVIGTDEELVGPTLAALATSLVLSTRGSWRIELIHGLGGRAPTALAGRLAELLTALGAEAVITAPANLAVRLAELARPGPATLVIGLGLDAVKGLEDPDPDTFATPLDDLRELVRSGSDHDRLLVGWWRTRRAVDQQLGFDAPGLRAWSLCGVSRDDVEAVCGPLVRPPQGSPRTLWHDRGAAGEPRVLVPFAWPDPESLAPGGAA